MISNYLKALIDSNNRIIIPDFGAFMIQDSPEGKQISFNDFLKFNDGLLVNQIIKTDKISKNQASDIIKEFIAEVEKSFSQNKAHKVEGLGFLSKDSHGNIKFEAKIDSESESKTPATDIKPTIVLDEEPAKPVTKKEEAKPIAKKPEATDKIESAPVKEVKKVEEPSAAIPKIEEVKTEPLVKSKPEIKVEHKPTEPKLSDKKHVTTTMKNENNNTKSIIIIIAALVIVSIGVFGYLKFKESKELPVVETIAVPEPVIDTVAVDTIPEPIVVEEEPIDENIKKFYLIAGSFKVPSNADRFNKKLIGEGFESEVIVRKNGFHCVSYKTFYTWNEVVAEWRNMKDEKPGIWILIR